MDDETQQSNTSCSGRNIGGGGNINSNGNGIGGGSGNEQAGDGPPSVGQVSGGRRQRKW